MRAAFPVLIVAAIFAACSSTKRVKGASSPSNITSTSTAPMVSSPAATIPDTFYRATDPEGGGVMYIGRHSLEMLSAEEAFGWMRSGSEAYTPARETMAYLKSTLRQYRMTVFLGTWCSDSQTLIPQLQRVLQEADYPQALLTVYSVNREKQIPGSTLTADYKIERVPTIIVMDGEKEIGRVVESTAEPLEQVLAAILRSSRGEK